MFANRFVGVMDTSGEILQQSIGYLRIRSWSLVALALILNSVIMMEVLELRSLLVRVLALRIVLVLAMTSGSAPNPSGAWLS
ncbi:hypothetical protein [Neolewinella litorea]|uniref:Uncharacterized protein n=1 Tax=Neolewinella litorea TaxID=2562452 RepID=A0A4S4NTF7_9BACT|nr:hypothetical protein [Neolewinella litorea]THH41771.1 hypothetical protein E4021_04055 [Neolewinella litorea]